MNTAKPCAILIASAWTLLALSTLGFSKTKLIFLSTIVGSDPVIASVKIIINTILGVVVSAAILRALGVTIGGVLFYIETLILGLLALYLGHTQVEAG